MWYGMLKYEIRLKLANNNRLTITHLIENQLVMIIKKEKQNLNWGILYCKNGF